MSQGRHRARRSPLRFGAVTAALAMLAGLLFAAAPVQAAPAHLILAAPSYTLYYGDALNVEARLDSAPGGGTFTFYANGTVLPACAAVPLGSNGLSAFCTDTSLTPGSYTITAQFNGFGGSGVLPDDAAVTVSIDTSPTYVASTFAGYSETIGAPFTASATLTGARSNPLAGKTLTFSLSSGGSCTGTTDGAGMASCDLTPTAQGSWTVSASFAAVPNPAGGAPLYDASQDGTPITVTGVDAGLTLPTTNVPWGTIATITATVNPAATGLIYFQGPCSVLTTVVAGKASCTAYFPTVGLSVLDAQYSGDGTYAMADTTATVNVTQHDLSVSLPTIQPALEAGVPSTVTVKLTDATTPGTTVDATPFTFAVDGQSCSGTTSWSNATAQAIGTCQLTPSRSGTFSTTLSVSSTTRFNDLTQVQSMAVADNPHTVTFDGNGGTSTTSQSVTYNGTATQPADPTRTGYTFTGWYDGGSAYDFTTAVTADLTLTAHWSVKTYTATFDSAGGTTVTDAHADYDTTYPKPADPTRTGYTFTGWYDGGSAYDFATPVTGNLTLTAHWQINSYTATFDSNGGSTVTDAHADYHTTYAAPSDPTRTGYTFAGWYDGATLYDFATTVTGNLTLTAHWTINTYTATFDSNGGTTVADAHADYQTVYPQPADPTRTGYTFTGWYDGGTLYDFATAVTGNLTLTAHWTINTYTATFDSDGGTTVTDAHADFQTTYAAPSDPTRTGYAFTGWYDGATPYDFATTVTGNLTLTAHWVAVAVDAGLADSRVTTTAGTPVTITPTLTTASGTWPVPAGGWSATTGDKALTLSVAPATGTVTAHATVVGTYTLTVHSAVGDATATVTVVVTPGPLAQLRLKASDKTPRRGDTITLTTTGADAWGNGLGDVTAQTTFTSSMQSDTVRGNHVTFHHASPHVLTAHGPNATTASLTVHVTAPTATHHDSSSTPTTTGTLPATGSSISPYWPIGGGAAVLLGLVLTLVGARRRS